MEEFRAHKATDYHLALEQAILQGRKVKNGEQPAVDRHIIKGDEQVVARNRKM